MKWHISDIKLYSILLLVSTINLISITLGVLSLCKLIKHYILLTLV